MIIWQGFGFLVAVFAFVFALLAQLASNYITNDENYWDQNRWVLGLALLAAGIVSWYLGRFLARRKARVVIVKETNKEMILENKHSLFFIKMYYWGPILGVIGLVLIVINAVNQ
jgi:hypothetical protein